jgi:hypothetical protein
MNRWDIRNKEGNNEEVLFSFFFTRKAAGSPGCTKVIVIQRSSVVFLAFVKDINLSKGSTCQSFAWNTALQPKLDVLSELTWIFFTHLMMMRSYSQNEIGYRHGYLDFKGSRKRYILTLKVTLFKYTCYSQVHKFSESSCLPNIDFKDRRFSLRFGCLSRKFPCWHSGWLA